MDFKEIENLTKSLGKINQTHVSFPFDGVMIKKDELISAEQIDAQMHLNLKGNIKIILKNTNFNQYQDAWNK